MTTKTVSAKKKTLLAKEDEQSESEVFSKVSLSASSMGAILADSFNKTILPKAELLDVANALQGKIESIQAGDMKPIEAMLISQAQALQTMFVTLGRMAANKTDLAQYTAFMNMALKAQSQSRSTIQALIELKYPKQVSFVKQANIASGNQQVNNGTYPKSKREFAHAREISNQLNELLEANDGGETMEIRTKTTTSRTNQAMATLEA